MSFKEAMHGSVGGEAPGDAHEERDEFDLGRMVLKANDHGAQRKAGSRDHGLEAHTTRKWPGA